MRRGGADFPILCDAGHQISLLNHKGLPNGTRHDIHSRVYI